MNDRGRIEGIASLRRIGKARPEFNRRMEGESPTRIAKMSDLIGPCKLQGGIMTALDITNKQDLIKYLNENPHEATIEIADIELEGVCTIKDITWPYGEVTGVEVDLVSLNGIPAKWHSTGIIRLAEEKLSKHEDVLVDVRSTVQYVLDMNEDSGDRFGDLMDEAYEKMRDREVCNG